jgi:hypothetical protein
MADAISIKIDYNSVRRKTNLTNQRDQYTKTLDSKQRRRIVEWTTPESGCSQRIKTRYT